MVMLPRTTGMADSSVLATVWAILVLAWPIWPTSRMSCLASMALSRAGTTSSSKPIIPGYLSESDSKDASRFRLNWSRASTIL